MASMPLLVISQAVCADYTYRQVCNSPVMVCVGPTGNESCTATTYCHWEVESTGQSGPPLGSTPPPPPNSNTGGGTTGSATPSKTIEQIEKEAHEKWCADQKANLPGAVLQCKTNAGRSFADALRYICNGETSRTIQGGITVYAFGGTVSSTTSCSAVYSAEMGAQLSRCESDGFAVGRALEAQCK